MQNVSMVAVRSRMHAWFSGFGRLSALAVAQGAVQVIGFATGLCVVRVLSVHEYAYYTIASAVLGTMSVLTDSGISESVIASGGRVWQSRRELGTVIASGMYLRRRFAMAALVVSLPVLYVMLRRLGAAPGTATGITLAIIPSFAFALTGQILEIVPRLHQSLAALQRIQIVSALLRLVLVAAAAMAVPAAWLMSLCAGIAQGWANRQLRRAAAAAADLEAPPRKDVEAAIRGQVMRSAPSSIYYAFSGQITVWLISVFGTTVAVAQVGALSRLAVIYNVLGSLVALLLVPRFARLAGEGAALRRFWQMEIALIAVLAGIVLAVAAFPGAVLWVLGRSYALLEPEVVLTAAGGALAVLAGSAYAMAAARGIVIAPWIFVPCALTLQLILATHLPVNAVAGALWLGIVTNLAFWMAHTINFCRAIARKS
jgi:O-antigen/teichoic acid export membrane protein